MFKKEERSSFKYWFAHWCAFQMTALNLKTWKWKYLFHDIEKPWMMLWYTKIKGLSHTDAYKKVQKWHRAHNRHHIEYGINNEMKRTYRDYIAMVIDWECSRFTKESAPRTALEEYQYLCDNNGMFVFTASEHKAMHDALNKLGLQKQE